ncbi:conserved hypothetical protein [Candidatus Terasakiella magnetica]|nr:conserved hypothetical protein [Candidatus Terasakiella magnetica]
MADNFSSESCNCQVKARRFADYVRLHASQGKYLSFEDELQALKTGVSDFDIGLDEAKGVLYRVAEDRSLALQSQTEQQLRAFLTQLSKKGTISHESFSDAVSIYRKLTHNAISEDDAKKRVKAMVLDEGLKAKRLWKRLGSRKWFNRIG